MATTPFEHEVCGRCCGTGNFGPLSVHNGKCFGCGGRGFVLTKRGAAAARFYRNLRSVRADQVRPGDMVYSDGVPGLVASKWCRIQANVPVEVTYTTIDGIQKACTQQRIDSKSFSYQCAPDQPMIKAWTKEQNERFLQQSLEYQSTLTKKGEPSKRRQKEAA